MALVILTDADSFMLDDDGKIAASKKQVVLTDSNGVRVYKRHQLVAIMRQDFADQYEHMLKELERLRLGDPKDN